VWRSPNTTHSSLLPGISNTMPLIDLLYRRFLKFVYRCLSSRSFVVNFIARHIILFCRMNSIVGRNVLSGCQRYSTNIDSVIAFRFNIENIDLSKCALENALSESHRKISNLLLHFMPILRQMTSAIA